MKIIKEPQGPVVEIVNPPKRGVVMEKRTMRDLLKLAEMNKAKRLLIVFER
ncbi:MAG: hypothetical protein K2Y05_10505 [Hyphomicrobiaceae bacterium]|nr:hypothetical protein [Hyphomicrobiaceae bacterium]